MIDHDKYISNEVTSRTFEHKGQSVEEHIFKDGDHYKMAWVKDTWRETVRNGVANPFFSQTFAKLGGDEEAQARKDCEASFNDYWFDENNNLTTRNMEEYQVYKANHDETKC